MDFLPSPATLAVADRLIVAAAVVERIPDRAHQVARADAADWGRAFEHGCRSVAPVLVLIGLATYAAGFRLGCWVHSSNDWLAARWVALWGGSQPTPEPQLPRIPRHLPAAPAPIARLAPAPVPVDGLAMALQLIAAGVSIRQAARKVGMPRTTLQRKLREVAA